MTDELPPKIKYDGLIEVHPDEVEAHKKAFYSKEIEGKIYFPFQYVQQALYQRFYGLIKKKRKYTKRISKSSKDHPILQ